MGRPEYQPFLFPPDGQAVSRRTEYPATTTPSATGELFSQFPEQEAVIIERVKVVAAPEVKTFRRTRNGRTTESKEWLCRVQYLDPSLWDQEEYKLLVLHATTQYEQARKLRVKEDDILRVSGILSASPIPLGDGSKLPVHHLYLTTIERSKPTVKQKQKPPPAPPPQRLF